MATLLDLIGKSLHRLDPRLEAGEMEARVIFGTDDFVAWVGDELPRLESSRRLDLSPLDQFDAMTVDFCVGEELVIGPHFHCLRPIRHGVWELKSPDLRLFGWFPVKDHFVAVRGHHTDGVKRHNLYAGFVNAVVHYRDSLDLDPPKFLQGDDPDVVVSNWGQP